MPRARRGSPGADRWPRARCCGSRQGGEQPVDANPFSLSGGEHGRDREPRVMVLDEPTFGQDRRTWQELVRLIASLVDDRGCAVVAVTHDPDVERVLGDRTLRLGAS